MAVDSEALARQGARLGPRVGARLRGAARWLAPVMRASARMLARLLARMRVLLPRARDERIALVAACGMIVALVIALSRKEPPFARGPKFAFAEQAIDLRSLFRSDARAPGAPLTLRAIYIEGRDLWLDSAKTAAQRLAPPSDLLPEERSRRGPRGGGSELLELLTAEASLSKRVSLLDLKRIVAMESSARIEVGVNRSGYVGLFQLGESACADVGVSYEDVRRDWRKNLVAGARFVDLIHKRLGDALAKDPQLEGIVVDPFLLYLAHQQGVSGTLGILRKLRSGAAIEEDANGNLLNNLVPGSRLYRQLNAGSRRAKVVEFYVYMRGAFDAIAEHIR